MGIGLVSWETVIGIDESFRTRAQESNSQPHLGLPRRRPPTSDVRLVLGETVKETTSPDSPGEDTGGLIRSDLIGFESNCRL